jgi:flagellar biosynthesis protein FlhG
MSTDKKIYTVGGGKGGIGKSILSVNLAVATALAGNKVVLVDTDIGSSNVHALMGIRTPTSGFHDFFTQEELDPNSYLLDTVVDNLKILSCAGDLPGANNLSPFFHHKILTFIVHVKADYIFLDLAPGTNHHTADFFNLGDRKIVVTTPEITSVMNTFGFIKATLFRKLSAKFDSKPYIRALIDYSMNPDPADQVNEVDELKAKLKTLHPPSVKTVDAITNEYKLNLIINRVRSKRDITMVENLIALTKKYLNIDVTLSGYLVESDNVRKSVDEMVPFMLKVPESKPGEGLQDILKGLTNTDINIKMTDDIFAATTANMNGK